VKKFYLLFMFVSGMRVKIKLQVHLKINIERKGDE